MRFLVACLLAAVVMSPLMAQYEVGSVVKPFALKNVDGKMVNLNEYADAKGVIVIFDCNTCPYSRLYNDRIIGLHKAFKTKGFPVVTINTNDAKMSPGDSFDEMVGQAKRKKYEFPYLYDESQEVGKSFGATNTPHAYVLQRKGEAFVVAYIGAIDNNSRDESAVTKKYVEDAVNALLANRPVDVPKTKAIGCGIKYRKN